MCKNNSWSFITLNQKKFSFIVEDSDFEKKINQSPKDILDIINSIKIEQRHCGIHVYALAVNDNCEFNKSIEISTNFGTPLTHEVHDIVRDVYCLEGEEIYDIGFVPVNYMLFIEDSDWETCVPLPLSVIKRSLSDEKKNSYFNWSSSYNGRGCHVRLVQFLETN